MRENDLAAVARYRAALRGLLERARALDEQALSPRDRVTRALFVQALAGTVGLEVCHEEEWAVSPRDNPFVRLSDLPRHHTVKTVADADHMLARLHAGARWFDDAITNMTVGLSRGRAPQAETVRRTIAQLDEALARPTSEWRLAEPTKAAHEGWTAADGARFSAQILRAIDAEVRPAATRYRDFLRDKALPRGRSGKDEGLGGLPDGAACYRAHIVDELGEARTAEDVHALGLREIAKSDAALAALGKKALGAPDLAATLRALRTDSKLYFRTKEELLAAAADDLARARAATPRFFGHLPKVIAS